MLGKAFYFIVLQFQAIGADAHSLEEVKQLFEQEPIPTELEELTKELGITAGMKSVREQAHVKQHQILEQYVRARTERKCTESLTTISRLDQEIVDLRERGQHEQEQAQREARDITAAFIAESCPPTSLSK